MKTLTRNCALLLMLVMAACGSNKKSEDSDKIMACEMAPPAIESIKFTAPVIRDDAVEEETSGYGSNSGAGAPMNFTSDANSSGEEKVSVAKIDKKKIIKDGSLGIKAKNIFDTKKSFDALLKKLNAYYENEGFEKQDTRLTYTLKIRVPSINFEKLISEVENGKDEIVAKSINARDVTEEYVDIEARLTNKREYLKKYKEILSKANTVKDILVVQENIRNLQEEIESKEGRLKYLNDQVSYSTLDVDLFKEIAYVYKPQEPDSFKERVKNALNRGWMTIVNFVLWLIKIWPELLVALLLFLFVRRMYKKRKANG
jgi:uncharacterized protein DUF4349